MAYLFMLLSLAITCYDEAGGQGDDAMRFVADTVINRVHSPKFPDSVTGVIYQKDQFKWTKHNRHSSVADLKKVQARMMKRKDPHGNHNYIWLDALEVSAEALAHDYRPRTHNLYFSTSTIKAHSSVSYTYRHHHKR